MTDINPDIPGLHVRDMASPLTLDEDSHTAEGLIVPWGKPAPIIERRGNGFVRYDEQFEPGSLDRAMRVPHRVGLFYTHDDSLQNRLGYGVDFRSVEEGMHATFRLDKSMYERATDILSTSHQSLSVGFRSILPKPLSEMDGALVRRVSVHLDHVAAVTEPAYDDARVLAVREEGDDGEPTDAEKADLERRQAAEEALEEARALVEAGAKWAHLREDGTVEHE